jgi:hypothetical protein
MNPAGQLPSATRQLITQSIRAAGLVAESMRTALGALSHTALLL